MKIREKLFELQDTGYKDFNKKLIPNISEEKMIGIRIPELRKLAKNLMKENREESIEFMENLPHKYFEENNLHGFMIGEFEEIEITMDYTERFLEHIDNWSTCDSFLPKIFKKYPKEVHEKALLWLQSEKEYTVRFAIGVLMSNYLGEEFKIEHFEKISEIRSEEYYVNMMIAWYFATALSKRYEESLEVLKDNILEVWTHNKTIQKACESRRITKEQKEYLRTLKRSSN